MLGIVLGPTGEYSRDLRGGTHALEAPRSHREVNALGSRLLCSALRLQLFKLPCPGPEDTSLMIDCQCTGSVPVSDPHPLPLPLPLPIPLPLPCSMCNWQSATFLARWLNESDASFNLIATLAICQAVSSVQCPVSSVHYPVSSIHYPVSNCHVCAGVCIPYLFTQMPVQNVTNQIMGCLLTKTRQLKTVTRPRTMSEQ